jgi:hypothetical protein
MMPALNSCMTAEGIYWGGVGPFTGNDTVNVFGPKVFLTNFENLTTK